MRTSKKAEWCVQKTMNRVEGNRSASVVENWKESITVQMMVILS